MKKIVTLFILTVLFAACKKDEADPRVQYTGVYDVNYTSTTIVKINNNQTYNSTSSVLMNVNLGQHSDEIVLTADGQVMTAQINGSKFTIPQMTLKSTNSSGAVTYSDLTEGSGTFDQNKLTLKLVTVNTYGTTTNNGVGIKR